MPTFPTKNRSMHPMLARRTSTGRLPNLPGALSKVRTTEPQLGTLVPAQMCCVQRRSHHRLCGMPIQIPTKEKTTTLE